MEYGKWEVKDIDENFVEIIVPHPSGKGFQSLGYFRKADLMPIVNLIVAAPKLYECLKGWLHHFSTQEGVPPITASERAIAKVEGKL